MHDRAKHFFAQIGNAVDLNQSRGDEMAALRVFCWNGFLMQDLAFGLTLVDIRLQFFLRRFVDHRADIGGQIRRIANHEAVHCAFEHGQQLVGDVFLHVQHAQS